MALSTSALWIYFTRIIYSLNSIWQRDKNNVAHSSDFTSCRFPQRTQLFFFTVHEFKSSDTNRIYFYIVGFLSSSPWRAAEGAEKPKLRFHLPAHRHARCHTLTPSGCERQTCLLRNCSRSGEWGGGWRRFPDTVPPSEALYGAAIKTSEGSRAITIASVIYYAALRNEKLLEFTSGNTSQEWKEDQKKKKKIPDDVPSLRNMTTAYDAAVLQGRLIAGFDKSGVCLSVRLPVINHTAVLAHTGVVGPSWIILTYLAAGWTVRASEAFSTGQDTLRKLHFVVIMCNIPADSIVCKL